jgi:fructosamine-3-kinase
MFEMYNAGPAAHSPAAPCELPSALPSRLPPALPPALRSRVLAALRRAGDTSPVRRLEAVRGGAESHALRLVTREGAYFLKWSDTVRPGRYAAEARGLALLRQTGAVRVPEVLAVEDTVEEVTAAGAAEVAGGVTAGGRGGGKSRPGFFLQEWLERPSGEVYLKRVGAGLGRQVAVLHRCDTFWGRPVPGYTRGDGLVAEGEWRPAGWETDWVAHYRERLLRPRVEQTAGRGGLAGDRLARLERVLDRLDTWLGGTPHRPSLLHGDLHRGNVLCDRAGTPVLVDPSPSFGDRELELAYLELYGRFPPLFFAAYKEAWPLAPGYTERRELYFLYHFLGGLAFGRAGAIANLDVVAYRLVGAR